MTYRTVREKYPKVYDALLYECYLQNRRPCDDDEDLSYYSGSFGIIWEKTSQGEDFWSTMDDFRVCAAMVMYPNLFVGEVATQSSSSLNSDTALIIMSLT
jgi:hypothetical protein